MSRLIDSLKLLSTKTNKAGKAAAGNTVDKVLEEMAKDFDLGGDSVVTLTSMVLYKNSQGQLTGGKCVLSNGTEVPITVTTSET